MAMRGYKTVASEGGRGGGRQVGQDPMMTDLPLVAMKPIATHSTGAGGWEGGGVGGVDGGYSKGVFGRGSGRDGEEEFERRTA